MINLQNISYLHPDKELLFSNISMTVAARDKIALIGNNGAGKSTLLKIIAKELQPADGQVIVDTEPYFVPQIYGQFNQLTIAEALGIDKKLNALKEILNGATSDKNFTLLKEDWTIEDRCMEALDNWQLNALNLWQKMDSLSGGEKTKVFLAGISIHRPELILLDEPSNHLDHKGRRLLYDFIESTKSTLIVVSHDRKLLNFVSMVCELGKLGMNLYGGNYDFYAEQKRLENNALSQDIQSKEKALKKAKEKEQEAIERQQKLDSRGKGKQEKAGVSRIMMNTLRNSAEKSTSKLKAVHAEKLNGISLQLQELRSLLADIDQMKFGFPDSRLHKGKVLFSAMDINFTYAEQPLWYENLTFQITSGERISLKGENGTGKTTLIKLVLGDLEPQSGTVHRSEKKSIYIDQDYSLLNNELKVYEQAQQFNTSALQEHEIKIRLSRFLFTSDDWDKSCSSLSGGEKMRLMLCCLTIGNQSPDIIVLDEPTNNLDIQNIEILTAAINQYKGTLIVVSHDETFLGQVNIQRTIRLL
jgi:ATPase subunit of ABC transporter with duplicated ATPase domains